MLLQLACGAVGLAVTLVTRQLRVESSQKQLDSYRTFAVTLLKRQNGVE